ncbi:MAG: hypothetical protein K2H83_00530 [Duncaniella sp.]|nr:hypothetical protein [Duncaniella sp.]
MHRRLIYPLLLLFLCLAATGCGSVGCTDNQNSIPLAGFYSMSDKASIRPDSLAISGVGAPNDSLLLGPSARASQVYLPLRSGRDETRFCISYRQRALDFPELNDTITVAYASIPYFASEDCGAMYHYRINALSYTTHLIDSIGLTDSVVTNIERETIQIYFRTSDNDDEEQD